MKQPVCIYVHKRDQRQRTFCINRLNVKKAIGPDKITITFLKQLADAISLVLTFRFQQKTQFKQFEKIQRNAARFVKNQPYNQTNLIM